MIWIRSGINSLLSSPLDNETSQSMKNDQPQNEHMMCTKSKYWCVNTQYWAWYADDIVSMSVFNDMFGLYDCFWHTLSLCAIGLQYKLNCHHCLMLIAAVLPNMWELPTLWRVYDSHQPPDDTMNTSDCMELYRLDIDICTPSCLLP